jgi:hypothetical protein
MYRKIPEYKAKIAKAQKTIRTHYSWEYNTKQWLTSLEAVDGMDQSTSE